MPCSLSYFIKLGSFLVLAALVAICFLPLRTSIAASQQKAGSTKNPLKPTLQNTALGLDHYDGHCAVCHGEMGKAVKASDLTGDDIQGKADAALFKSISGGVPRTAMAGFGKTHSATEIWQMVLFLRRLPGLTPEDRTKLESAIPPGSRHHTHQHHEGATGTRSDPVARRVLDSQAAQAGSLRYIGGDPETHDGSQTEHQHQHHHDGDEDHHDSGDQPRR